jgi:hypothetical protein
MVFQLIMFLVLEHWSDNERSQLAVPEPGEIPTDNVSCSVALE